MTRTKKNKAPPPTRKAEPSSEARFYARRCGMPVEEAERLLRQAANRAKSGPDLEAHWN
jgi:hypothetical protein